MEREAAIRQELFACAVLIPAAVLLPVPAVERLLIILSMLLVVLTEFLNSAIEAAIDRISLDRHPLSGQAKDLGSAAVAVALLMSALCWIVIAGPVAALARPRRLWPAAPRRRHAASSVAFITAAPRVIMSSMYGAIASGSTSTVQTKRQPPPSPRPPRRSPRSARRARR
jgi:diacylglycerol kinase